MQFVACHGGAASSPKDEDGPELAAQRGLQILARGGGALEAAVTATASLEDDVRFNAGTGSNLRLDGETIEMDAACMTSAGAFAAVAAIERVKNPVLVAQRLLATPHILVAGAGATAYARQCGFEDYDPSSPQAKHRLAQILSVRERIGDWSIDALREAWNFATPLSDALGHDTVGAVAWDGAGFACASSSGGTTAVLRGRVGDVPLPGCALYAGPAGAVAATGDGEHIARALLAYRAYLRLEGGNCAEEVAQWALSELPAGVDIGVIVANEAGFAGTALHEMAWCGRFGTEEGLD